MRLLLDEQASYYSSWVSAMEFKTMSGLENAFTLGVAAMEGCSFYYPVDVGVVGNGRFYGLDRPHEDKRIGHC